MINNIPVLWSTHKQTMVALSSMETEYMTLSDASREAIARSQFFQELDIKSAAIPILSDSQSALDMVDGNTGNYRKSKHIDIRYHASSTLSGSNQIEL